MSVRIWLPAIVIVAALAAACGGGGAGTPDYSGPGPFSVGLTFLTMADDRPVDVWYPAKSGTGEIADPFTHNLNDPWPDSIRDKVPQVADIVVDAYVDVQADEGPFPVILESHGFASTRRDGSLNHRQLASWGFIVIAPEHFERNRATIVGQPVEFVEMESVDVLLGALDLVLQENMREGSVLEGTVDGERIAVDGVSAGGRAALELAADPRIGAVVGRAPAGTEVPSGAPFMIIASDRDVAVELEDVRALYAELPAPRSLAVILDGGHNTFTDACAQIREEGGLDIEAFAEATGFPAELLEFGNNGCTDEYVDPAVVWPVINHLQIAHIRWALGIDGDDEALTEAHIEATFPGLLLDYTHEP